MLQRGRPTNSIKAVKAIVLLPTYTENLALPAIAAVHCAAVPYEHSRLYNWLYEPSQMSLERLPSVAYDREGWQKLDWLQNSTLFIYLFTSWWFLVPAAPIATNPRNEWDRQTDILLHRHTMQAVPITHTMTILILCVTGFGFSSSSVNCHAFASCWICSIGRLPRDSCTLTVSNKLLQYW